MPVTNVCRCLDGRHFGIAERRNMYTVLVTLLGNKLDVCVYLQVEFLLFSLGEILVAFAFFGFYFFFIVNLNLQMNVVINGIFTKRLMVTNCYK